MHGKELTSLRNLQASLSVPARDKPAGEGQCLYCSHVQLQGSQAGVLEFWERKSRLMNTTREV